MGPSTRSLCDNAPLNMTSKIPIFFAGATGYVGGSLLSRLLVHPSANTFDITAIVRSPEKAEKLKAFGVTPVVGSLKDLALVEDLTSKAHVVFSLADSDDLPAIQAILKGLRKRHETTGDVPILIHTSGTGLLTYNAGTEGMSATEKVYDDSDADDIEKSFPEDAFHRNVDLSIVRADQEGYLRSYIVLPSTIWCIAKNTLVDAGISNPYSMQIPTIIRASLARGRAGMVGKGLALWPSVEIDEVTDLYIILYDAITANLDKVGHGRDGYYFGIAGEHSWYDISKQIGRVFVELGISTEDEPTTFSSDELVKYFGSLWFGLYHGTNSRGVATHSRSLGWNPKKGTQEMLASIKPEIEAILKRQKE